jgi:hypothetical protein
MSQALRVALWIPTADPPDVGDNVVTIGPTSAQKAVATKFALAPSASASISEAPADGTPYARQDAGWVPINPIDAGVF